MQKSKVCNTNGRTKIDVTMKIAALSRVSGTHRSTIHHDLDLGLLPRPETVGPRLRRFGSEHVERSSRRCGPRGSGWRRSASACDPPARGRLRDGCDGDARAT